MALAPSHRHIQCPHDPWPEPLLPGHAPMVGIDEVDILAIDEIQSRVEIQRVDRRNVGYLPFLRQFVDGFVKPRI